MRDITLMEPIVCSFINVIYIYSIHLYFETYFQAKKPELSKFYIAVIAAYFISIETAFLVLGNEMLNLVVNMIFMLIITLFYESKVLNKLISIAIIYIILIVCESLTAGVCSLILSITMEEVYKNSPLLVTLTAASKLILLIAVKLLRPILAYTRKDRVATLPLTYWLMVLAIPAASIFVIVTICRYTSAILYNWTVPMSIALILFINFLTFYLYDGLLKKSSTELDNILLNQQIYYYEEHFREMEKSQDTIRSLKHDMKNQLAGMFSNIQSIQTGDFESIREDLKQMLGEISGTHEQVYSGFPAIDAIINYKASYAADYGIKIHTKIKLSEDFKIDRRSISIILGNALDNAIEACIKIDPAYRYIYVVISEETQNLYISVRNPYMGRISSDNKGFPVTTKQNAHSHGIGLKSIKHVVEELNGLMKFDYAHNEFILEIILFCV